MVPPPTRMICYVTYCQMGGESSGRTVERVDSHFPHWYALVGPRYQNPCSRSHRHAESQGVWTRAGPSFSVGAVLVLPF